jgi:tetratricopeptide (TPR) repeat protein
MNATFTAEEYFERGRALLAAGDQAGALEHFRTAHELDPTRARYRSFHGLGLALAEGQFDRALELCRSAAKEEFFNPDIYHNLALVHLAFGFKAESLRYLRRGLMLDPTHGPILEEFARLGQRSRPVLRFLPRDHALNRWLGHLRGWTPVPFSPPRRSSPETSPPAASAGAGSGRVRAERGAPRAWPEPVRPWRRKPSETPQLDHPSA